MPWAENHIKLSHATSVFKKNNNRVPTEEELAVEYIRCGGRIVHPDYPNVPELLDNKVEDYVAQIPSFLAHYHPKKKK